MPLNSLCLHFADQDGVPTIWAEVDVEQPVASKSFKIVGTGHLLDVDPAHRRYVGTYHSGPFVWHLYELIL
jgi:hypothetical protein